MKWRVAVKNPVTMREMFERPLKDTTTRLQLLCQCAANTNLYSLRRFDLPVASSFFKFKFILKKASDHLLSSQVLCQGNFKHTLLW